MMLVQVLALIAQSPPLVAVTPVPAPRVQAVPPSQTHAAPAPPVPLPRTTRLPQPRTPVQSLITFDDYPASALRNGEQGRVGFTLGVSADGRAEQCVITRSSGSAALDSSTCRLLRARARFTPALDSNGNPAPALAHGEVEWRLP
jgi:protein TonB